MLENWQAMGRFRRAKRLAAKGELAGARALCREALDLVARVRNPGPMRDANVRLTKLVVLALLGATSLDLGEEEDARAALCEWSALLAESRKLYPMAFDRDMGEEWVRRKLDELGAA